MRVFCTRESAGVRFGGSSLIGSMYWYVHALFRFSLDIYLHIFWYYPGVTLLLGFYPNLKSEGRAEISHEFMTSENKPNLRERKEHQIFIRHTSMGLCCKDQVSVCVFKPSFVVWMHWRYLVLYWYFVYKTDLAVSVEIYFSCIY